MPISPIKGRRVLRAFEVGFAEVFLGFLIVVGLIGYFGQVSAELGWLDHTVSFLLFSYLFYRINLTSLLFGFTRRRANVLIIVSFLLLFFKDIMAYTVAGPFTALSVLERLRQLFISHGEILTLITFHAGIAGLVLVSIILSGSEVGSPSLMHALIRKQKRRVMMAAAAFLVLLFFYYFVYNMVLEWLEFVLDDPVIIVAIVFYVHRLAARRERFHAGSAVFRIGDFAEGAYTRFVSLFHYRKTLPLAISGLLILHALSDLGVFAYTLSSGAENFYLQELGKSHPSFIARWQEDALAQPTARWPLAFLYGFNAVALVALLLIPAVIWSQLVMRRKLRVPRLAILVLYAAIAGWVLAPAFTLLPISGGGIIGVNIASSSLAQGGTLLDAVAPRHGLLAAAVLSFAIGGGVFLATGRKNPRKEIYMALMAASLLFYAFYLYYFMGSELLYFATAIMAAAQSFQVVVAVVLSILLAMSAAFYILGFSLLVYEIVMEYHHQKWSEPVDEEIVGVLSSLKRAGRKAARVSGTGR